MENLKIITENTLETLIAAGAEKAQCTASLTEKQEFNVDSGEFTLFRTLFDKSLDLKVIKDEKRGKIQINSFEPKTVANAVKDCMEVAASSEADCAWDIAPCQGKKEFIHGVLKPDMDKFFQRVQELVLDIKTRYPLIMIEQMVAMHDKISTVYQDSNGNCFSEETGYYSLWTSINGIEGDNVSSMSGFGLTVDNLDFPFIDQGCCKKELADTEMRICPAPMDGKFTGTMLLVPDAVSQFMNSLIENYIDDNVILEGTSQWKEKLGKQVVDERLTISSKPLDSRIINGQRFTADGFAAKDFDFIENGVLKNLHLSQYVANKTGNQPAPNTSLSLIIKEGRTPLEKIIEGTEKGIIVGSFSGGRPNVNGEFSGVAKNSFLVENGKITGAVTEAMINGNLGEMLNHVEAISSETVVDGSNVVPYIAVSGIVVTGK